MVIYEKSIANIIIHGKKIKTFLLISSTRQGCPLLLFLFNIVLEILEQVDNKKKKRHSNLKKKENHLFPDDMIIYMENSKDLTTTKTVRTDK